MPDGKDTAFQMGEFNAAIDGLREGQREIKTSITAAIKEVHERIDVHETRLGKLETGLAVQGVKLVAIVGGTILVFNWLAGIAAKMWSG